MKKWGKERFTSIEELEVSNKALRIFDKYRFDDIPDAKDYYVFHNSHLYEIIREMIELLHNEYPLYNFPKFPHEDKGTKS